MSCLRHKSALVFCSPAGGGALGSFSHIRTARRQGLSLPKDRHKPCSAPRGRSAEAPYPPRRLHSSVRLGALHCLLDTNPRVLLLVFHQDLFTFHSLSIVLLFVILFAQQTSQRLHKRNMSFPAPALTPHKHPNPRSANRCRSVSKILAFQLQVSCSTV